MSGDQNNEELRNKLREGIKELQECANIEIAVGSQLDRVKAQIEELKSQIAADTAKVEELSSLYQNDESLAKDELGGEPIQQEPPKYEKEIDQINKLEEKIRQLSKRKAELLSKAQK